MSDDVLTEADVAAMCALANASVQTASYNPQLALDARDMTHRTVEEDVVDQKHTGTCWLQAGVTFMSALARRRGLKVRFSITHLVFWDKLGKAEAFLRRYAEEPDERARWHLVHEGPVTDGGTWGMFMHLVCTYGLVPHDARLPMHHATDTSQYNKYLNHYLKAAGRRVRAGELRVADAMGPVLVSLLRAYAPPVDVVRLFAATHGRDWVGRPADVPSLVRQEWPYVVLCHAPDRAVGVYSGPFSNDPQTPAQDVFHVVPLEVLVAASVRQLECGVPIWVTCDVSYDFCPSHGVAERGLYNTPGLLGLPFTTDKVERMEALSTAPVHAMLLTAVKLVDGAPRQWRIQNSWGKDTTHNEGFLTAGHDWFRDHVFQVAVDRCFVDAKHLSAKPATPLPPWDIFATVA